MFKNVASQKVAVFAWDNAAGSAKTGDAANISAQISIDGGVTAATDDAVPSELDSTDAPGIYLFDMLQAETNGDLIVISPVSGTSDIVLRPVIIYTQAPLATIGDAIRSEALTDSETLETIGGMIHAIYCAQMQKQTVTESARVVYKLDDSTTLRTQTLADDDTTVTRGGG